MQVGFATTFEFYAYPDRSRLRLSQLLVLPPHQRVGVGRALLDAVHCTAEERDALDVVVRPGRLPIAGHLFAPVRCGVRACGIQACDLRAYVSSHV